MRPVLKGECIRQLDAWLSAALLLLLPVFSALVLLPTVEKALPDLSPDLLVLLVIILTEVMVLGYCMSRYGTVRPIELFPRGIDYVVLVVAILILFWAFGLTVGREGLNLKIYDSIRDLSALQYWSAVVTIAFFGPLLEETFFRRYFLEILRHRYSRGWAAGFTVGIATLFHLGGSFGNLMWACFFQLVFTLVYLKSRLGVSVVVHSFVNALILFLAR